jgi:hypothetical protein
MDDRDEMKDRELLVVAEALGIPWRRLLESEIQAERELKRCLGDLNQEMPLWRILAALQMSVLDSWRIRERISALSWEARAGRSRKSGARGVARGLKTLYEHLSGKQQRDAGEDLLRRHLEFAHRRILELQAAARVGEKSRGVYAARVRHVVEETGCLEDDARWSVDRALAPRGRTIVEDVLAKARAEGFEIPRGETDFRSLTLLRRFVRAATRPSRSRPPAVPKRPQRRTPASPAPAWTSLKAEARFPLAMASR